MFLGQGDVELLLPKEHRSDPSVVNQVRVAYRDIDPSLVERKDKRSVFSFQAMEFDVRQLASIQMKKPLERSRENRRAESKV
jgi:hypothetical protein